ncbi:MAG TPA: proteasome-type protease [Pseudomonadales bacterium]|nr:proteasome-type protease [Pseudomonadales bacterium]
MTYCVAMLLEEGLLFASDSRTNAGVDHIATFRKMHLFQDGNDRRIAIVSAGNLATTQSVISQLQKQVRQDDENILSLHSLYDVATLVGKTVREVIKRDSGQEAQNGVDYSCSLIVGGQIRGEAPRLFNVYTQGNFIEATVDTPYFQIGESKYGKPIIDRVINSQTSLAQAVKCALISFDSTIRSNISVGPPIDVLLHRTNDFSAHEPYRFEENHPYLQQLRSAWSSGLNQLFGNLPDINTEIN